jgi:protease-4
VLLAAGGCGPTSFVITPVSANRDLVENEVLRESFWASQRIALINLDGLIANAREGSLLGGAGENPVAIFKERLDKAAGDTRVKAVVLRINSPGGGVTASDLMYDELRSFRERTGKPVIACMMDVAASGGYYVACAADRIVAHPTSVVGSIGVIMIAPDLTGTMQKIGVKTNVIKSGALKDAGSPFREMNETDRAVFEGMIQRMYERFVEIVAAHRKQLPKERVRELADGRVYMGDQAAQLGLVDQVGTLHDALLAAKSAAGAAHQDFVVVQYGRPLDHRPNVYAAAPGGPPQVNLFNLELPAWLRDPSPQFLYLWSPGW